jgi:hypothetical protein
MSFAINARQSLPFALIGALSFWTPDVAVHGWARHSFDTPHLWAITFLMPIVLLIAYLFSRRRALVYGFRWTGLAMVSGVWLTGGLFIMLSATLGGGGFASAPAFSILLVFGSVIPILTCMLATYDGSLLALLVVTSVALLIWGFEASGLKESISRPKK